MRPALHLAAGKGHKEFHLGSTWFCVRKERRLTPDVWGQETLLLPSLFSCILSLSSNVSCLLSAGHSFRGDGVRKRWPPESLHPAQPRPAAPIWGAQHQRGAPQSMGCHGVPGTSRAAFPALFDLCALTIPRGGRRPGRCWGCSSLVPVVCTDF